ncbi:MAG: hypothetical protein AB8H86_31940 [Polyangiales bacterium]
MALRTLLLLTLACGGTLPRATTPAAVQPSARAPRPVCEFEGEWSGTLHFEGADTYVSSATATVQLFPPNALDARVSGGGWHLHGRADSEDAVLRLQETTWLGQGVAVSSGLHVAVSEAGVSEAGGEVRVRPLAAAMESISFAEAPGRTLGCESVGLLSQPSDLEALQLPEPSGATQIAYPFALSHLPGGAAFVEVRARDIGEEPPATTMRAEILQRRDDAARVRVKRFGDGSHVILVGWIDAERLDAEGSAGMSSIFGSMATNVDHEECEAPTPRSLFVEGEAGRSEVGSIDAGTRMRVTARDAEWAEVRPLGDDISLATNRRFFVPNTGLQCTTRRGTHLRETHRVQVRATGLSCGAECECELQLTRLHEGRGTCQARLECGTQVLFGDRSTNGFFMCNTQQGHVSGADTSPSSAGERGDPRFGLEGDAVSASDDEGGRLGVFSLEGRIIR